MTDQINLGNGKVVYVTFDDESEKRDFDVISVREGPRSAYAWWLNRHKRPKKTEELRQPKKPARNLKPKQPSLFDDVHASLKEKLRIIMEEPHMFWYPALETSMSIPGTDKSFKFGFDLRLERWAPHLYKSFIRAITREGIIGLTTEGWYFMLLPETGNPVFRPATEEEIQKCLRLPDEWLDHVKVDDWG